jgi:lysophospholipase L1-like esterase
MGQHGGLVQMPACKKRSVTYNGIVLEKIGYVLFAILSLSAQTRAQTSYKFDFGISANPPVAGYTKVVPTNKYTAVYANDNVTGAFGFENWDSTAWGGCSRGATNDNVNRDFIYSKNHNGFSSFYFSVCLPEGKYTVTFYIGDPGDTSTTTIKAESRRLLVENLHTAKGELATRTFTVLRREPAIAGGGTVGLDYSYGRELPAICLDWDHKLTFEFSGARPCIGGLDIVKVDTGITFHMCGNSTLVEQENEPWACWGQFIHRFYNSSIMVNDLANSGQTSSGFMGDRRLAKISSVMKPGDYLFFEFGHNDSKGSVSQSQFQSNMKTYYDSATKHGATMVFVSPTARSSDNDSTTSVGGYAQYTRNFAKTLSGAKLVDLNAAVIHMKTALATPAYGGISTAIYCYAPAGSQWPDMPKGASDGTHFCDFGGYELAKWVTHTGLKAAGVDLSKYLLDTAAFNPDKPDLKSAFNFPYSLDTVFRHPSPGATIYSDLVGIAEGNLITTPHRLTLHQRSFSVAVSSCLAGNAVLRICTVNGKTLAQKRFTTTYLNTEFSWTVLKELPSGMYIVQLEINTSVTEKCVFYKL